MIGPLARSLASDRFCMTVGITVDLPHEQTDATARPAPPISNRFLFVNVAAMRAKQLRRGAKPRLGAHHAAMLEQGKAERNCDGRSTMWSRPVHSRKFPRGVRHASA
jgi:RNA polymerase Rpb6